MKFHAQIGQDRYLYERYFRETRGGVFVDIGAYDGVKFSNTYFFEKEMDWTGICIEPNPEIAATLRGQRSAVALECAVADFDGESEFCNVNIESHEERMLSGLARHFDPRHKKRIKAAKASEERITVRVRRLNDILDENGLSHIDYCSIDTEGAELAILRDLDFGRFDISLFSIENNYGDQNIRTLMEERGYELVKTFHGYDQLYVKKGLLRLPVTTVLCPVWHKDPNRCDLLLGHQANLDAQTVPVDRIYIFDGNDVPPGGLVGHKIVSREPLTIYQAWNIALSAVRTPYVMNLSLDDRLATNAVAEMEDALWEGADIVGGDWRNCFSQEETDQVESCLPLDALPVSATYPPKPGTLTRLGTGDGQMKSLGHACLWQMALHRRFPRVPYRFKDGTLIRAAGDLIWWSLLQRTGKRIARLPMIIGNYHSHPADQAEFRGENRAERNRARVENVALI